MREVAAVKPVVAVIDDLGASAAYAIASGANRIFITRTAVAGSIGVVLLHIDHSKRLSDAGVVPTLVHAGAHKVDGTAYRPLPKAVRDDWQLEINKLYAMFVDCVDAGRPNLTPETIRKTEARCFMGQDAIDAGLADEIGSLESVLEQFTTAQLVRNVQKLPVLVVFTQDDLDRARAEGRSDGLAESVTDGGMAAALERIRTFTELPEAQGRQHFARHLASVPQMTIEAAKGILPNQPTEASALRDRAGNSPYGLVVDNAERSNVR